jgi:hypothetical protein
MTTLQSLTSFRRFMLNAVLPDPVPNRLRGELKRALN